MALTLSERLRELLEALDRRVPRAGHPHETAVVRDAADLRQKAVKGLAGMRPPTQAGRADRTVFPGTPGAVAVLTTQEFAFAHDELERRRVPSLERVCGTFGDDANRALVWCIRFGALKTWSTRTEALARLTGDASILRDACEAAAGFPLNQNWEFDPEGFGSAIAAIAMRRAEET